jgi:thioredoxin-dependent peroxiredoxin
MTPIQEGAEAPLFSLTDKLGTQVSLTNLKDDYVVLFFYPKDNTPGCTIEAKEFNGDLTKYKKYKAAIIGISGGTDKTKEKFCQKHDLELTLLSDPDFKTSIAYNAYGEKSFMGKKFKGILRKTYVLNRKRKIIKIFDTVKPKGHSDEVLAFLASQVAT